MDESLISSIIIDYIHCKGEKGVFSFLYAIYVQAESRGPNVKSVTGTAKQLLGRWTIGRDLFPTR